jgi:hypothetical protein
LLPGFEAVRPLDPPADAAWCVGFGDAAGLVVAAGAGVTVTVPVAVDFRTSSVPATVMWAVPVEPKVNVLEPASDRFAVVGDADAPDTLTARVATAEFRTDTQPCTGTLTVAGATINALPAGAPVTTIDLQEAAAAAVPAARLNPLRDRIVAIPRTEAAFRTL